MTLYIEHMRIAWTNYIEMCEQADEAEERGDEQAAARIDSLMDAVPAKLQQMFPDAKLSGSIVDDFDDFEGWDDEVGMPEAVVWTLDDLRLEWAALPAKLLELAREFPEIVIRVGMRGCMKAQDHIYVIHGKIRSPGGAGLKPCSDIDK